MTMMRETTVAKMGRSMKNLENTARLAGQPALLAEAAFGAAPGGASLGTCGLHRDRAPRPEHEATVDDDPVAGREALVDEPLVPVPASGHDGAELGLLVRGHHPDEAPLGPLLDGPLRHEDRLRPDGPEDAGPNVLVRTEDAVRVREARPDEEGPGGRVVRRVGEGDPAPVREDLAAGQVDLHVVLAALRLDDEPPGDPVTEPLHLALREAEVDPDRREDGDRRQLAVLRADVGAVLLEGRRGDPRDRGRDRAVRQVQLVAGELGLRLLHARRRRLEVPRRVLEVLLGEGVLRGERARPLEVQPRGLERGLLAGERRCRGVHLDLERLPVHQEEDVALLHERALRVDAPLEEAVHPGLDVDQARALGLGDVLRGDGDVARGDGHDGNFRRRRHGRRLLSAAARREEGAQEEETAPASRAVPGRPVLESLERPAIVPSGASRPPAASGPCTNRRPRTAWRWLGLRHCLREDRPGGRKAAIHARDRTPFRRRPGGRAREPEWSRASHLPPVPSCHPWPNPGRQSVEGREPERQTRPPQPEDRLAIVVGRRPPAARIGTPLRCRKGTVAGGARPSRRRRPGPGDTPGRAGTSERELASGPSGP